MASKEASSTFRNHSPELKQFLARSVLINDYYEKDFDISFSSLFWHFWLTNDPISKWFGGYVKTIGIDVRRIMAERNVNQRIIDDIASRTIMLTYYILPIV